MSWLARMPAYWYTTVLIALSLLLPWYHFHDYDTWGSGWFVFAATFVGIYASPGWSAWHLVMTASFGALVVALVVGVRGAHLLAPRALRGALLCSFVGLLLVALASASTWLWGVWVTLTCIGLALINAFGVRRSVI